VEGDKKRDRKSHRQCRTRSSRVRPSPLFSIESDTNEAGKRSTGSRATRDGRKILTRDEWKIGTYHAPGTILRGKKSHKEVTYRVRPNSRILTDDLSLDHYLNNWV